MNVTEKCKVLCSVNVTREQAKFMNQRIKQDYIFSWLADSLPAARPVKDQRTKEKYYRVGFELGEQRSGKPVLHNHYEILIEYNKVDEENMRIVGVLIWPASTSENSKLSQPGANCMYTADNGQPSGPPQFLSETKSTLVTYSYNVYWVPSPRQWNTRWDVYLNGSNARVHWFSLINSVFIVIFLSLILGIVLVRALHKDIARYVELSSQEEAQEEFGWKLVHGDVFRAPRKAMLLSVMIGNGAQLFCMVVTTLLFSLLGFLSPASRGALSTVMLLFYVLFASIAGYVSARTYKMLGGNKWKANVLLTASLFPGIIFSIFTVLNFLLISQQSSAAVPAGTLFLLIGMWFFLSLPLCTIGAYYGFKAKKIEQPVRTNQIPRQIPDQPLYLNWTVSMAIAGILPFGAIFIELYYIMSSIWLHKFYYLFGFLFLVVIVLVITCSQLSILLCYFHLNSEDYRWWWRSYFTSGASAFYVFAYGIVYYFFKLELVGFSSKVLYFGWILVASLLFFLLTGFIGAVSCFFFIRRIYSSIKVD